MSDYDYDLVVIGSGPAGHRAAIQASKVGKRVLLAERKAVVGGVCINTGTIPSKTLREAVLHLSGYKERGVYSSSYSVKQNITIEDLVFRTGRAATSIAVRGRRDYRGTDLPATPESLDATAWR